MTKLAQAAALAFERKTVAHLRRFPREPDQLVYGLRVLVASIIRGLLRFYLRFEIIGREHLPNDASFVLVANHSSHLDTLCLLAALPLRRLHRAFPVAAEDYFFRSLPRTWFAAVVMNAMPFGRGMKVRESLALCRRLLAQPGNVLIIFPEGTRSQTGKTQPFKPGIGALLAKSKTSVLPCYIQGTFHAWPKGRRLPRPRKVRLIVGPPQHFAGEEEAVAIAARLERTVEALRADISGERNPSSPKGRPATKATSSPDRQSLVAPSMEAIEQTMVSWDGTELFYRAWLPNDKKAEKALLLFHRGHEHSGRWQETVDSLGLDDIAIFAWDARGHGRSAGERGAARDLADMIKDVAAFARQIAERYEIAFENMIVLAHSLAAVTVTAWVHDYAPPIRALILATAAFEVKLYVPLAVPALRLQQRLFGTGKVKSYVRAKMLTHDAVEAARYEADPLIFRQIAINVLLDLHETAQRLLADAGAIHVPTLVLAAGKDWVVSLKAQRKFYDRLSSRVKRMHVFPAMFHAIFHEGERRQVIERMRVFIGERFADRPQVVSLREADKYGYAWEEYERLKLRGSPRFIAAKVALRIGGRLSKGIDLGWQSGFDSGRSLDYIYENRPQGSSRLGKFIDTNYLNSIGWRGIRQRKANLERALRDTIEKLETEGRPIRILDIAAGAGRYVLETMSALPHISISATLRDNKEENVDAARALAEEFGLKNVAVGMGDAFDRAALAAFAPRATIGVVSGLYELFSSNDAVLESLGGLAGAVEPGGYLIYTNQPWHPQLEFIARVLRNREGRRWIMRRRSTAEIDELVRLTGFEKCAMEIDRWGMFSVTVARRTLF